MKSIVAIGCKHGFPCLTSPVLNEVFGFNFLETDFKLRN